MGINFVVIISSPTPLHYMRTFQVNSSTYFVLVSIFRIRLLERASDGERSRRFQGDVEPRQGGSRAQRVQ